MGSCNSKQGDNLTDQQMLADMNLHLVNKNVIRRGNFVTGMVIPVYTRDMEQASLKHYYKLKKLNSDDWNRNLGVLGNRFREDNENQMNAAYVVEATQLMLGICRALSFMHGKNCYHRSLSSETCVVVDLEGTLTAKLCGLETATTADKEESKLKSLDILRAGLVAFGLYKRRDTMTTLEKIPPKSARDDPVLQQILSNLQSIDWETALIDASESRCENIDFPKIVRAMIFEEQKEDYKNRGQPSAHELYTRLLKMK
ncbi:protein tyrosine kinase [Nitzschia inconspicua]|uniref:Protein tyrosine kinase n=1 Tax=Nitzschia inconspicua TaxID=303405 RepID=A0A9K3PSI2_9STRA|nr:protein tyrosine kinase [Nitzschia inconspicua]